MNATPKVELSQNSHIYKNLQNSQNLQNKKLKLLLKEKEEIVMPINPFLKFDPLPNRMLNENFLLKMMEKDYHVSQMSLLS